MAFLFPFQVAQAEPTRPILVGYYPEWGVYERKFNVSDTPAEALDVINYAFAKIAGGKIALSDPWADVEKPFPGDAESLPVKGNFHQLALLKARHPHLKCLISVGGWTMSGSFSDAAVSDASRETFARSVVSFVSKYGFDGVDIDWEYPVAGGLPGNVCRPADKRNFSLLLAELRKQFDAQGRKYYLSAALPAGAEQVANLEIAEIAPSLDWVNLMTYDFHGGQESITNHQAPLVGGVDAAVDAYLKGGLPMNKLILGVPAYGRSWKNVKAGPNHGLFQRAAGVPHGTWDDTGIFDYKDLVAREATGWTRYWDSVAKAPWIYTAQGIFVSFEDNCSLVFKLDYVKSKGLGGMMLWDLSSDVSNPADPNSLIGTARRTFGPGH